MSLSLDEGIILILYIRIFYMEGYLSASRSNPSPGGGLLTLGFGLRGPRSILGMTSSSYRFIYSLCSQRTRISSSFF